MKTNRVELTGTKVTFFLECGHKSTKDFSKGPISKRIGTDGLKLLVKYWRNSGVYINCAKCHK